MSRKASEALVVGSHTHTHNNATPEQSLLKDSQKSARLTFADYYIVPKTVIKDAIQHKGL